MNAWPPEPDPADRYRGRGPVDPPPEQPPEGPAPGGPVLNEPVYPPRTEDGWGRANRAHDNRARDNWAHDNWAHDNWAHDNWAHDNWAEDHPTEDHPTGGDRAEDHAADERGDEEQPTGRADDQVRAFLPGDRGGRPPRGCMYLLVAFGAVLFFVAPFSVAAAFLLTMSGGPDDGARDWLEAVRDGRYDAAVGLMCPRYRDTLSAADLRARLAESGGISRGRISRTDTLSDTVATVAVDVKGPDGTADRHVTLSLAKDGDHWRVCSLP